MVLSFAGTKLPPSQRFIEKLRVMTLASNGHVIDYFDLSEAVKQGS